MEGNMSCGPSPTVSIKSERQGEGNYASTAVSYTRDQETVRGLTLPPKIQSNDPWHFDAGNLINDEEVEALLGPVWPNLFGDDAQKDVDAHTSLLEHNESQLSESPSKRRRLNDTPSSFAIVTGAVEDIVAKKQSISLGPPKCNITKAFQISQNPTTSGRCPGALVTPQGPNCKQNKGIGSEPYHHISSGHVSNGIDGFYLARGFDEEMNVQDAIPAQPENEEVSSARTLGKGNVMESLPMKRVPWDPDMPIASIEGEEIPSYEINDASKIQFGCKKSIGVRSGKVYSAVAFKKNGCLEPSGTRKNHKCQHKLAQTSNAEQRNPQVPSTLSHGVAPVAMADNLLPPNGSKDLPLAQLLAAHQVPPTFLPLLETIYTKISQETPFRLSCLKFLSQKGVLIRGDSPGDYVVLEFGAASQTVEGQTAFDQDYNRGLDGLSDLQSAKELIKAERRGFRSKEQDLQAQIRGLQRKLDESHPQISPPSQISSSSSPQPSSEPPSVEKSQDTQVEVPPPPFTINQFWKCLYPASDGSICGAINNDWYRHRATWVPRMKCAMCLCSCFAPHRKYIDPETAAVLGVDISIADMSPVTELQRSRPRGSSVTPGTLDDYHEYLAEVQAEKFARKLAQQQNLFSTGTPSIPTNLSTNKSKPSSHSQSTTSHQSNGASLTTKSKLPSYLQPKPVANSQPTSSYKFNQASSTRTKQLSRYCSLSPPPQIQPRIAALGSLTLPMTPSVSKSHATTLLALQTPPSSVTNVTINNFTRLATNTDVTYGSSRPPQIHTQTQYRSPYPEAFTTRKRKATDDDEVSFVSSRPRLTQPTKSYSSAPSTILSSSSSIRDQSSQGSDNRTRSQGSRGSQGKKMTRQNPAQQRISDTAAPSGTTATVRPQLPGADRIWMRPPPEQVDFTTDQTGQLDDLAEISENDSLFGDYSEVELSGANVEKSSEAVVECEGSAEIGGDANANLEPAAWEAELEADLTAELERQGF